MTVLLFLAGLGLLVLGAEALVRGASRGASAAGISPLVVGLTVVAFGTSAPELAVTVRAAWAGVPDLALGNVVGSNIFNLLFILGISAVVTPLVVAQQLVRLDVPLLIGVSVAVFLMALDGRIGRADGLALVAGVLAYTVFLLRHSRAAGAGARAAAGADPAPARSRRAWAQDAALVLAGLAMLVWGSHWLVAGAVALARALGVSELVIALTLVAAGTSLPEVATSVVAGLRGERDIAVGNAVGSSLFNLLAILGAAAALAPHGIRVAPGALRFDLPVMVAAAVACLPIFFTGYRIARWEGLLFLAYYGAYVAYLYLDAARHDLLDAYERAMLFFVLPLTAVTLATLAVRAWRRQRPAR